MSTKPIYQEDKLAELMLYVSAKCEGHPKFGSTKLNKVLFYSDFQAYFSLGRAITGAEYRRRPFGPAATKFLPVQRKLEGSRAAVVQGKVLPNGRAQQRLIPLRQANLDLFAAKEIAIVDSVIEKLRDMTAEKVSEVSHSFPGWALAAQNEVIPYFTALLLTEAPPLSAKDSAWASSVAARPRPTV
jgi:hypothetical protein